MYGPSAREDHGQGMKVIHDISLSGYFLNSFSSIININNNVDFFPSILFNYVQLDIYYRLLCILYVALMILLYPISLFDLKF